MKNLIKKILKEETYRKSMENLIRRYGIDKARSFAGSNKRLLKYLGVSQSEDFFNILAGSKTPIETKSDRFLVFEDKYGRNFFMYDNVSKNVTTFGKSIDDLKKLMMVENNFEGVNKMIYKPLKDWISKNYNIQVDSINEIDIADLSDEDMDVYMDFVTKS